MAIHSVSEVNRYVKGLLGHDRALSSIMVRGEISNFKRYASGHCYFSLKDAAGKLKAVMFRGNASHLRFQPEDGLTVVASGSIEVYERDGVYQLIVRSMAPEGIGDLALAYEQLKAKLAAEGLFDAARKKELPAFPQRIGVVTSRDGAVLRDIYHVSSLRWPGVQLVLHPVLVQGEQAAPQIAAAIRFFNERYPVDVLIVGRGGGSLEDLWPFNEECVVRAIAASHIPVISAVGHETDVTLADFAADRRAATPSQAAEFATPDRRELMRYVAGLRQRLQQGAHGYIASQRQRLEACRSKRVFREPHVLLEGRSQQLDTLSERLHRLAREQVTQRRHRLELALNKLDSLNPAGVLRRGYTMVERDGRSLTSVRALHEGDDVVLKFWDGAARASIEGLE